jgi:shikimate kinase
MTNTPLVSRYEPRQIAAALGPRNLVFVGLMGAGKTVIGKLVAEALGLSFVDSDLEIERVSTMTIPELFQQYGEAEFRALESRVIERLLKDGPRVISTGGGAYINEDTRRAIARRDIAIWLKADLDTLMARVSRRPNRPLLQNDDPRGTMQRLIEQRYPVYAEADITVESRNERKDVTVRQVLDALGDYLLGE